MHGSGIARCAFGDARQTRRAFEAVRNGEKPDVRARSRTTTMDAAEADARTELRERCGARSNEGGEQMETVELSQQQSARMAELP
jgi:hypothetical protein